MIQSLKRVAHDLLNNMKGDRFLDCIKDSRRITQRRVLLLGLGLTNVRPEVEQHFVEANTILEHFVEANTILDVVKIAATTNIVLIAGIAIQLAVRTFNCRPVLAKGLQYMEKGF